MTLFAGRKPFARHNFSLGFVQHKIIYEISGNSILILSLRAIFHFEKPLEPSLPVAIL